MSMDGETKHAHDGPKRAIVMGEGSTMCLKQQSMMGSDMAWCHAKHDLIHEQCIGFGLLQQA